MIDDNSFPPGSSIPPVTLTPLLKALKTRDHEGLSKLRHALRTPLNQIIGYSELLMETAAETGTTALLWPPTGAPEVKIVSLGGQPAPADPKSGFGTIGADVSIPTATTTPAIIETTNVEQASQVKVRITPRDTYNFTEVDATYASTVSTSPLVIRWTATLPTNLGYSAVQVKVIRP